MQSQNHLLDDMAKLASGMAGTLAGMGRELENLVRKQVEKFIGGMDFVRREEFEVVKDMAANARAEVEALKARLDALHPQAAKEPDQKA